MLNAEEFFPALLNAEEFFPSCQMRIPEPAARTHKVLPPQARILFCPRQKYLATWLTGCVVCGRLWDSYVADKSFASFHVYVCAAGMVIESHRGL